MASLERSTPRRFRRRGRSSSSSSSSSAVIRKGGRAGRAASVGAGSSVMIASSTSVSGGGIGGTVEGGTVKILLQAGQRTFFPAQESSTRSDRPQEQVICGIKHLFCASNTSHCAAGAPARCESHHTKPF